MSDVWDEQWFGSTKTLDVHIAALRRKIGEVAASARACVPEIVTLRGYGYRLELGAPDDSASLGGWCRTGSSGRRAARRGS
jgi:hypothetical protein